MDTARVRGSGFLIKNVLEAHNNVQQGKQGKRSRNSAGWENSCARGCSARGGRALNAPH